MTIRKIYSVLMIGLLLFGIGYPATGAFAEGDQADQFEITETELTNENDEKIEEVDAEKQVNAKFHLKMTGKQARENDGTVLQLLGTDSLSIKNSTQQITPEVMNGTFVKAPKMSFKYSSEFSSYLLNWNKTEFENIADDQVFDYEISLPLEIQTITEDFKADISMKFTGMSQPVPFGSLNFVAPVENEKTESASSISTEKESETASESKKESAESKAESEDDSEAEAVSEKSTVTDHTTDVKSSTKKSSRAVSQIPIPDLPDRSDNPLGVAANFHIFAENFTEGGGNAHTSGNIAVNSLTSETDIGNEGRDERWQETSYVKNYDGRKDRLTFKAAIFGGEHSLGERNNGAETYLTGGPLGGTQVSYQYKNEGDNITGAAIKDDWIDVTGTLNTLKQTRNNYVNTPYKVDFNDTRYLNVVNGISILDFTDEQAQSTFVIDVNQGDLAGKNLEIRINDNQNLIFIATPVIDSENHEALLGAADMDVYVDGEQIGADPEKGGNKYNYSILWVIPEDVTDTVKLMGNFFFGTVLAPSQTVKNTTNFNGTIVADTYLGSTAETHSWTYNPTTPVIPEPEDTRLVLRKTVEGTEANKQEKFEFVITREDIADFTGTLKMRVSGESTDKDLRFINGKSEKITLTHDQFMSLVVPNGSAFSIEEVAGPLTSTSITFNNDPETTINGKLSGTITMGTKEKGESQIVDYVNSFAEEEPKTKDLQIKKTVSGSVPDGTKFKFDLSIDPAKTGTYKYLIDGGDEKTIEFNSEGKATSPIELTAGQTVTIKDLPETSKVTVNEVDADGYKTDITYNGEKHESQKTIEIELEKITGDSALVVFNNHLTAPTMPVTGGIGNLIIILVGLMVLASGMWLYRKKVR